MDNLAMVRQITLISHLLITISHSSSHLNQCYKTHTRLMAIPNSIWGGNLWLQEFHHNQVCTNRYQWAPKCHKLAFMFHPNHIIKSRLLTISNHKSRNKIIIITTIITV